MLCLRPDLYLTGPHTIFSGNLKCRPGAARSDPDRPSAAVAKKYHEDELAALIAHLKTQSLVVGTRPEMQLIMQWKNINQQEEETAGMFYHRIHVLLDKLANQAEPQQPS